MSLNLYDLQPPYAALAELPLESEDGGEDTDAVCEAVTAIRDEGRDKALSLAKVVKGLEAEVRLLEEHTRLLQSKTQVRRDRADFLKKLIRLELDASGLDRANDALITVWLQQSPPSVEVVDEQSIPPEFMRAVLRLPLSLVPEGLRGLVAHLDVDRAAILELVKRSGEVPDGVSLRTGERHLRFR